MSRDVRPRSPCGAIGSSQCGQGLIHWCPPDIAGQLGCFNIPGVASPALNNEELVADGGVMEPLVHSFHVLFQKGVAN